MSLTFEALSIAWLDEMPRPLPTATAIALLSTPIEERKQRLFAEESVERCLAICRLAETIDFFIKDYVSVTLQIIKSTQKDLKKRSIVCDHTINARVDMKTYFEQKSEPFIKGTDVCTYPITTYTYPI